jgi:hypothetical protein
MPLAIGIFGINGSLLYSTYTVPALSVMFDTVFNLNPPELTLAADNFVTGILVTPWTRESLLFPEKNSIWSPYTSAEATAYSALASVIAITLAEFEAKYHIHA